VPARAGLVFVVARRKTRDRRWKVEAAGIAATPAMAADRPATFAAEGPPRRIGVSTSRQVAQASATLTASSPARKPISDSS